MALRAIPCVLYVDLPDGAGVEDIYERLDEGGTIVTNVTELGPILPDYSRESYRVANQRLLSGPMPYKADITIKYDKSPIIPAGKHEMKVMAKNSLEAAGQAFEQFHRDNPIDDHEGIEVDIQVSRIKKTSP